MPQPKFTIQVRHINPQVSIIDIQGEMTIQAEQTLMAAYSQISTGDRRAIILNFSGLEYMNSSGIGLLVTLLIRVNRQGQRLMAVGLGQHYEHIFELTRLNEAIQLFPSEAAALAVANSA
jgi:anti-sigma B factor antagonist